MAIGNTILQGVLTWLPVEAPENHSLVLQFGALFAVLYYLRYDFGFLLLNIIRGRFGEEEKFFVYATLFTALIGLPLLKLTEFPNLAILNFLIGVAILLTWRRTTDGELGFMEAFIVGVAQGMAVLPGASRMALVLGMLLLRGIEAKKALRLSLLVSIPYIMGSMLAGTCEPPLPSALLSMVASFLAGVMTIHLLFLLADKTGSPGFRLVFGMIAVIGWLLGVVI
ncbi:undecaprenyl-diphosphate phosphatase [Pyrococcus yayanosii]|uniref:Undecaprenyl-diphosphatase n=1 Tax=Pyrococcus yayanosii (strain CH1 / JCM 16557) TaxID=529709 RepID=F8AFM1_PYRYC|nr:undecaprenyl-diphosphate phosphatase [Pyrococcus yayanosii]AEH24987.1 bacitracin resistance protein bacA-like protein [Pyrococcus yayanosii CH1]